MPPKANKITNSDTKRAAPADFEPIRVEPAYRQVAAALLGRITDRTISAGERLPPETELARQFGVHRGTVREALRELQTNGVLKRERGSKLMMVTRPERGDVAASVSRALSLHDVSYHDVWEALMAFEPPIAAAAARNRKPEDLRRLEALVTAAEGDFVFVRPETSQALFEAAAPSLNAAAVTAAFRKRMEGFSAPLARVTTKKPIEGGTAAILADLQASTKVALGATRGSKSGARFWCRLSIRIQPTPAHSVERRRARKYARSHEHRATRSRRLAS